MAAERSRPSGAVRPDAPLSDSRRGAEDRGRLPDDQRPRTSEKAAQDRTTRPGAPSEPDEINSIRLRRLRARTSQEPRTTAPSAAKKESDPRASPETASPAASAAKPASGSAAPDPWALPQSIRDRFVQDKQRFYFPDGAPAFRDHGKRLTTGSENTEVIRSLVEIARTRGWEEITVAGTERFRREAWRQGRLAGLDVRGYKPSAPERAALVRSLARQGPGAQMELEVPGSAPESDSAVREGAAPSGAARTPNARGARDLILGKLLDHGRESYQFNPREAMSYFIELGTPEGKRTIWGKDLERAMKHSLTQPQIGDEIAMRRIGVERVTVQRRERDADGRVIAEREVGAARNRWIVEKREFFEARAAAAEVLRDPNIDRRRAVRQHPELVGTYLQLHAAQLAARRIRDPQDREKFVGLVRAALADSVARGEPLQPMRLRDRADRAPEKKPLEREPGPARA